VIETLKPWLRAAKYNWLRYAAEYKARGYKSYEQTSNYPQAAFLIGCGRSGTTILGKVLSRHPDLCYLFEPYHLWAAIDPMTDVLNLYHRVNAYLLMDASNCTEKSRVLFHHLLLGTQHNSVPKVVIEKTPLNSMRIGYLNALASGAKFIHIVRDGVDISYSIERIASMNSYKIAGKPMLNQWWGVSNYKWKALAQDGAAAGYYANEVERLEEHRCKGAYEWLVSLGEVDRWREQLGDRLHEITYEQLTANPEAVLGNICKFLDIDSPRGWLEEAIGMIGPNSHLSGKTLKLPPMMCKDFNYYQERFAFTNRAIPEEDL
jgi:hypothetical protein